MPVKRVPLTTHRRCRIPAAPSYTQESPQGASSNACGPTRILYLVSRSYL